MSKDESRGLLYLRITEKLKSEIVSRRISPGEQLPGVRALAARFETSGKTISRALDELEVLGFIERTQGKGIFARLNTGAESSVHSPLGCICPGRDDISADMIVAALEEQAGLEESELLIRRYDPDKENIPDIISGMSEHSVRGIFVVSSALPSPDSLNISIPLLFLGAGGRAYSSDEVEISSILWDLRGGMDDSIEHLADSGHERIGFIGTGRSEAMDPGLHHFKRALAVRGFDYKPDRCKSCSSDGDEGFSAAGDILKSSPDITALVCQHDHLAVGAMRAAAALGIMVPEELCIIGWGGTELGAAAVPSITTVAFDPEVMASAALGCMERISSRPGTSGAGLKLLQPLHLVIRESSVSRVDEFDDKWV
ncbi:MAG: GntR family transcriptional regulator [Spirochaetales bacterium]|nr:GntR family transcriptional regulator [Spirochaetales bacterium]